jgi:hypothetical protein
MLVSQWSILLFTAFNVHLANLSLHVIAKPPILTGVTMIAAAHARPGHFAELEELEAARKAGTLAAYDLFLARHPTSRYAGIARQERAALAGE